MATNESARTALEYAQPIVLDEVRRKPEARRAENKPRPLAPAFPENIIRQLERVLGKVRAAQLAMLMGVLAMLLTAPALMVGFAQDDFFFLSIFEGSPGLKGLEQSVLNTFTFSEGDVDRNALRMERGILPWWSVPDWKVNMWRPLASMSHWLDYKLFGLNAWPMHMHSLLLYGALAAVMALLYRQILPSVWAAGLAALLFAVDSAHGIPVGWLANRNGLLAGLFGAMALYAHHQWRRSAGERRPWGDLFPYGALSMLFLTLALFSSESSVALGAYFFTYYLFLDPLTASRECTVLRRFVGLRVLLPYLAIVVAWRVLYTSLGHGANGSWLYVDPATNPLVFAGHVAARFPILAFGLFGLPDSVFWVALPPAVQIAVTAGAWALFAGLVYLLWPMLRSSAAARFWFYGAVLAIVPVCATVPADRNLMYASFGAMAVVGTYLHGYASFTRVPVYRSRPTYGRGLAAFFLIAHLIVAPPALAVSGYAIAGMDNVFHTINTSVPADTAYADKRLIVINTPLDLLGASLPLVRSGEQAVLPQNWWWLCATDRPVEVTRIDARTIALYPQGGFLRLPFAQIFRRPSTNPLRAGDRVRLSAMEAEIRSVSADGRPMEVYFRFDVPLEDASLVWLTYSDGAYKPFSVPAHGQSVTAPGLDASDLPGLILGKRIQS